MTTHGAELELATTAGIWATWALLSDTDRLMRACGLDLGFRLAGELDRLAGEEETEQFQGKTDLFGSPSEWWEKPFDFEAPRWWRIERTPTSGPVSRWVVALQLSAHRGGTDIRCHVEVEAVGRWSQRRVAAAVDEVLGPGLRRALEQAVALLEGQPSTYDEPPPPLSRPAVRWLEQMAATLDPEVGPLLVEHIRHAPLHQQAQLSPIALAAQWRLNEGQVIRALVEASRIGVLTLEWADARHTVPVPFDVWDGRTPGSILALFRTNPRLRRIDVPVRCPFSPGRTPHVLARRAVRGRSDFAWQLDLAPDLYELVVPSVPRASLQARPGVHTRSATVDITEDGILPAVLRTAPGATEVRARSTLGRDVHLSLVTRTRGRAHLTAGRLVQECGMPQGSVERLLGLRRERAVVLAVQPLDDPARALRRIARVAESCRAESMEYVDDAVVATWPDPAWMLSAAEALACDPRVGLALGVGETVFVGAQGIPAGAVVEDTIRMARRAGGARTVVSVEAMQDAELAAAVERWGQRVALVPHNSFMHLLDFARARASEQRVGTTTGRRRKTGKMLGRRYRLGEELGRGGFGRVLEARDLDTGRDVAIKLLLPEYAADPMHAQRFYTEARITSSLTHANTLRVLDWGQAVSGELFLAMERLDGIELRQRLAEQGTLEPLDAARIAIDVLGSLGEAHQAGIVHRDIKPANIFLCTKSSVLGPSGPAGPVVKVIDFGIAWSQEDADSQATDDKGALVMGTPRYMSPEQLEGDRLDGRSDMYSLALTVYETVAGALPFEGPDQMVMAFRRVSKPIPGLREVVGDRVPEAFDRAIHRALRREVAERYPDCYAMQRDLLRLVQGKRSAQRAPRAT